MMRLEMDLDVNFTDEDWQRIERDWTAWWNGELERPLVLIEEQRPPNVPLPEGVTWDGFTPTMFPMEMPVDQVIDCYQVFLESRHYYGDAFPRWWPNFGPGVVAGFLGARLNCVKDTVWFSPIEIGDIAGLRLDYDPGNRWWQRALELTRAAVSRWGERVCVAITDLGGNLDILASLRTTQQLLLDLYDTPEEVRRLTGEITRLWLRYYDELYRIVCTAGRGTTPWAPIWSPQRCYMLQSDFSYMISPPMFERYVLPDLAACCEVLEHGFYHLDGKGEIPHLEMLLSLERLRGIQWIPGDGAPPPEEWLPLLKRIRDGGKLCQLFVSPEGAQTVVRELGGRGFALYVQKEMGREEAEAFLKEIYQ
jgi:5-methyltetrahydrofolate--homocysteine methyltransferase